MVTQFNNSIIMSHIVSKCTYYELVEVPDIIQKKIHYFMPHRIENDVLMIFYDLLMSDVVKCA